MESGRSFSMTCVTRGDVQRLDIHVVGDVLVGHDGGGVGVDQHHLHALLLQGAAGLGAGVVELGGLADDDGAGAQHQDLLDIRMSSALPVTSFMDVDKAVEQIFRILGAGAGLRVELDGKAVGALVLQALHRCRR